MGKKPVLARGDLSKMLLPEPLHRLIFVYNDLMDESIMNELCPEPKLVTTAMYSGFRFIINSDGVATLILEPKSVAYGVVWQIDEIALIGLDISVGRPTFFERNGGFKRNSCGAIVADHYMAKNSKPGTAPAAYIGKIIDAARRHQLPHFYIEELQSWGTSPDARNANVSTQE